MTNNILNIIFGTIGILWIVNLIIRIKVAINFNRVTKESEKEMAEQKLQHNQKMEQLEKEFTEQADRVNKRLRY